MKKIDRYILVKLLSTFFFSLFLFTIIAVVVDVSEKTDDFVKSGLSLTEIITNYYYGFVPHIMALLFPLFVFIATIYFTSKMAGRSEIIAILASGTSFNRLLRPFFLGGLILALLLWWANLALIPKANEIRTAFQLKYIDGNSTYNPLLQNSKQLYLRIDSFTYATLNYYDTATRRGGPFAMSQLKGNKLVKNTRAETLYWDTTKKVWMLESVIVRKIDGLKETIEQFPNQPQQFNFLPSDLKKDNYTKDRLTSKELARFIEMEELRGSEGLNTLKVELYRRVATPFSVILLTLIGGIVASRKVRGGSGSHLALGFVTAAVYIIADRFSTIFSTKGNFHPLLSAWTPNLIFIFIAIWFYKKAPK